MTDKWVQLRVETDDNPEGSPTPPDENISSAVPSRPRDPATIANRAKERQPAAETGLISSVRLGAEGRDNGDIQDASRTKDETRTTPVAKKETAKVMDRPLTVLIVEDTLELAEVIQATLEAMDLNVVHAAHGNKALEKFNELDPDLVLLDISLPDMTGWKIMDTIKERFETNPTDMPIIIIITAYDDPANRLVGKLQGVHSYLIKPFSADEIERTVSQAISSVTR